MLNRYIPRYIPSSPIQDSVHGVSVMQLGVLSVILVLHVHHVMKYSLVNCKSTHATDWTTQDNNYDCSKGISYLNSTSLQRVFGAAVVTVRRYLFLGDSTSRDSFHAFGQIFDYVCTDHSNSKATLRNKCTTRVKRDPQRKNAIISTAEFFPFGRKQGWKRSGTKAYRQAMKGYVAQLGQEDVLIFNMGLHFDETATSQNFSSFYALALKALVSDLSLTGFSQQQRCGHPNESIPFLPTVVWRDTLPQHFNSSNGHYPFHNTSDRSVCVPMTASQQMGNSESSSPLSASLSSPAVMITEDLTNNNSSIQSSTTCDPSCLPANWQNHIANALMADLCIDVLATWRVFRCLHGQHAKAYGDCSHLTEAGNHLLIGHLLQHIFVEKKKVKVPLLQQHKSGAGAGGGSVDDTLRGPVVPAIPSRVLPLHPLPLPGEEAAHPLFSTLHACASDC